jgi:hypothetical protein
MINWINKMPTGYLVIASHPWRKWCDKFDISLPIEGSVGFLYVDILFEYLTVKYNFGTQYGFRNRKCLLREVPL